MPEYTSTLILLFILVSCFYKKHIKDWRWFKLGLICYLICLVISECSDLIRFELFGHELLSIIFKFLYALSKLGILMAGAVFVIACFINSRQDIEHLRCLKCGYILKGISEPRCPECGWQI